MSNGNILLLLLIVGAPLLMVFMHRGGAHGGHGGGGCGGGGHSGHGHEEPEPRDSERSGPVLGKPGPRHNHPAPQTEGSHGGSKHRGC